MITIVKCFIFSETFNLRSHLKGRPLSPFSRKLQSGGYIYKLIWGLTPVQKFNRAVLRLRLVDYHLFVFLKNVRKQIGKKELLKKIEMRWW